MSENYNQVQFDLLSQKSSTRMSNQENNIYSNYGNSSMNMPLNNSNYSVENLSNNLHNTSINNYSMDYPSVNNSTNNNTNRFNDIYQKSYIYNSSPSCPMRPQSASNQLSDNTMNLRFNQFNGPNMAVNSSNKMNHSITKTMNSNNNSNNGTERYFSNNMSNVSQMMSSQQVISNNNSLNQKSINNHSLNNSSIKPLISGDKLSVVPSSLFYSASNITELNQQQMDNELETPKWIVFPPVHQTAIQLRQGKQHLLQMTKKSNDLPQSSIRNPLFIDEELRKFFINRISSCLINTVNKNGAKIPDKVGDYIDLTPMESTFEIRKSRTFGQPSICYKAYNRRTNEFVLFRRFPGLLPMTNQIKLLESTLHSIKHPGIIPIQDMFLVEEFEDTSTIFIMEYLPCATTALHAHMSDVGKLNGFSSPFNVTQQARPYSSKKISDLNTLPEDRSWCYLIQLINIIRYVHNTLGLCCRNLDPSKILIQYPNRIKLNCFGLMDLLSNKNAFDETNLIAYQSQDLKQLGQLMLCLICGTAASLQDQDFSVAIDLLHKLYSPNLQRIVLSLLHNEVSIINHNNTSNKLNSCSSTTTSPTSSSLTINDIAGATFAECFNHINSLYEHIDYLEFNLMKELECGKLFRLVCKIATICERNELGMDPKWSDYGPNYQLKLFRDFVFHQVDQNGVPTLDLAHMVTCLNKLDGASDDSVCLISRDQKNMFCTTFAELKKILDESFDQLCTAQRQNLLSAGLPR